MFYQKGWCIMKNSKIALIVILCTFLCVGTKLTSQGSIFSLKGMTSSYQNQNDGVRQEYKDLSPAVGALVWASPFIHNVILYGQPGDKLKQLMNDLFFKQNDGSISCTVSHTKVARYFSPYLVGQLVGHIYKHANNVAFLKEEINACIKKYIAQYEIEPLDESVVSRKKVLEGDQSEGPSAAEPRPKNILDIAVDGLLNTKKRYEEDLKIYDQAKLSFNETIQQNNQQFNDLYNPLQEQISRELENMSNSNISLRISRKRNELIGRLVEFAKIFSQYNDTPPSQNQLITSLAEKLKEQQVAINNVLTNIKSISDDDLMLLVSDNEDSVFLEIQKIFTRLRSLTFQDDATSFFTPLKELDKNLSNLKKYKASLSSYKFFSDLKDVLVKIKGNYDSGNISGLKKLKTSIEKLTLDAKKCGSYQASANNLLTMLNRLFDLAISFYDIPAIHDLFDAISNRKIMIGNTEKDIKIQKESKKITIRELKASIESFAENIIGALRTEDPAFRTTDMPVTYPRGTVLTTLLAFLWGKFSTIEHFRSYLDGLASVVSPQDSSAVYVWPHVMREYSRHDYDILKEEKNPASIVQWSIDDIIFLVLGFNVYENILPPHVPMLNKVWYGLHDFPDCGETSLRNLLNALVYNPDTSSFNSSLLKNMGAIDKVIAYYNRFNSPAALASVEQLTHDEWAKIVSGHKGNIKYANSDVCDLDEGITNMMNLFNVLVPGINTFKSLKDVLEKNGIELKYEGTGHVEGPNIKDVGNTIKLQIKKSNDLPSFELEWEFAPGHFELTFPPVEIPSFASFHKDIINRKGNDAMTLLDVFLLAKLGTSYTELESLAMFKLSNSYIYMLPLYTNDEKIEAAKHLSNSFAKNSDNKFIPYMAISLGSKVTRDPNEIEAYLKALGKNAGSSTLQDQVIVTQEDSAGIAAALNIVIDGKKSSLYDWFSDDRLQRIKKDDFLVTAKSILANPDVTDDAERRLKNRLYSWHVDLQGLSIEDAPLLVQALMEAPASNNAQYINFIMQFVNNPLVISSLDTLTDVDESLDLVLALVRRYQQGSESFESIKAIDTSELGQKIVTWLSEALNRFANSSWQALLILLNYDISYFQNPMAPQVCSIISKFFGEEPFRNPENYISSIPQNYLLHVATKILKRPLKNVPEESLLVRAFLDGLKQYFERLRIDDLDNDWISYTLASSVDFLIKDSLVPDSHESPLKSLCQLYIPLVLHNLKFNDLYWLIEDLWVRPHYQKTVFAKKIIEEIEKLLVNNGAIENSKYNYIIYNIIYDFIKKHMYANDEFTTTPLGAMIIKKQDVFIGFIKPYHTTYLMQSVAKFPPTQAEQNTTFGQQIIKKLKEIAKTAGLDTTDSEKFIALCIQNYHQFEGELTTIFGQFAFSLFDQLQVGNQESIRFASEVLKVLFKTCTGQEQLNSFMVQLIEARLDKILEVLPSNLLFSIISQYPPSTVVQNSNIGIKLFESLQSADLNISTIDERKSVIQAFESLMKNYNIYTDRTKTFLEKIFNKLFSNLKPLDEGSRLFANDVFTWLHDNRLIIEPKENRFVERCINQNIGYILNSIPNFEFWDSLEKYRHYADQSNFFREKITPVLLSRFNLEDMEFGKMYRLVNNGSLNTFVPESVIDEKFKNKLKIPAIDDISDMELMLRHIPNNSLALSLYKTCLREFLARKTQGDENKRIPLILRYSNLLGWPKNNFQEDAIREIFDEIIGLLQPKLFVDLLFSSDTFFHPFLITSIKNKLDNCSNNTAREITQVLLGDKLWQLPLINEQMFGFLLNFIELTLQNPINTDLCSLIIVQMGWRAVFSGMSTLQGKGKNLEAKKLFEVMLKILNNELQRLTALEASLLELKVKDSIKKELYQAEITNHQTLIRNYQTAIGNYQTAIGNCEAIVNEFKKLSS